MPISYNQARTCFRAYMSKEHYNSVRLSSLFVPGDSSDILQDTYALKGDKSTERHIPGISAIYCTSGIYRGVTPNSLINVKKPKDESRIDFDYDELIKRKTLHITKSEAPSSCNLKELWAYEKAKCKQFQTKSHHVPSIEELDLNFNQFKGNLIFKRNKQSVEGSVNNLNKHPHYELILKHLKKKAGRFA